MKHVWFGAMVLLLCCAIPARSVTGKGGPAGNAVHVSVAINNGRQDNSIILYQNGLRLRREDFRARPDDGSIAVAITGSTLGMNYVATRDPQGRIRIEVSVLAGFDPLQSWFKETVRNVPGVLDHEQLHFDITALMACRLRKALVSADYHPQTFQQELKGILADCQHRWQELEMQYDEETGHGTNREEQARWADWVRASLAEEGGV